MSLLIKNKLGTIRIKVNVLEQGGN